MPELSSSELCRLLEQPRNGIAYSAPRWESVLHILREARLLGTLAARAEDDGTLAQLCPYARGHLQSALTFSRTQARQVQWECAELRKLLGNVGIAPVFLKGAAYTLRGTRNSRGRISSDIDLLVAREALGSARKALALVGWRSQAVNEYDDRYYREWAHEIPPMWHMARGTVIDVHHNIVPPISGRAPQASLLEGEVESLGDGTRVFSRPAMALHTIVHLLVNDDLSYAFRDLVDLWLLLEESSSAGFWGRLAELAEATGFGVELWYALELVGRRFETATIDRGTLETLRARHARPLRRLALRRLLLPAIGPRHAEVAKGPQRLAMGCATVRGHLLKMPLGVLIRHTLSKAFFAARDSLFGKHQFEARPR